MVIKEGSTLFIKTMTPAAGVLVLGRGHISDIVKMHYFFKKPSSLVLGIEQTNYVYFNDGQ